MDPLQTDSYGGLLAPIGLTYDDVLLLPKGMAAFAANKDQLDYNPAADILEGAP